MTEYGLLIAFVALALVFVANNAGASIRRLFDRATCALAEYGAHGNGGHGNNGGGNNTGTNPNGSTNNGGGNNTGGGGC